VNRWRVIVCGVLLLVLGVPCAQWIWRLFEPDAVPVKLQRQTFSSVIHRNAVADLFNERAAVAESDTIQLKGVVVAEKERSSVAMLQIGGEPARPVGVGAEVLPGVTVSEVYPQYVLLTDHGQSKHVEMTESTNTQSMLSTDVPVHSPTLPVQSTGTKPSQLSAPGPNMVVRITNQSNGLPEIDYVQTRGSSNAPPLSSGAVTNQLQPLPNLLAPVNPENGIN